MLDCSCLLHPFQNDPGTSQRQRVMEDLLDGAARIDARTLADLLDYFMQMSRHINYYDLEMNINDWQPFFRKSLPFTLAGIIKFPLQNAEDSFSLYNSLFEKQPSAAGLQLNIFFLYHRFIRPINDWHQSVQDSDLPLLPFIEQLIKNKLQQPVRQFIKYAYEAVKHFEIKKLNFAPLYENSVWNLPLAENSGIHTDFSTSNNTSHARINRLNNDLKALLPILSGAVKRLAMEAGKNLEQSFLPLKEDLQKQHQPHLAMLFAFLNMFRQVQDDLNQYTRKHLDYFYKDILHFNSEGAVADKAHVIFEIQKQLKSYLLRKGLKVKDGKDENGQEILFELDDDIVVTQTTIADKRTLFVNNETFDNGAYVEGVYMAPVADKADGVEIDFKDAPKNYYTVGGKYSKFIDPEAKLIKPYPNARLGFVLASPVLYLQEGSTRIVEISIKCKLDENLCSEVSKSIGLSEKDCCNQNGSIIDDRNSIKYPPFYSSKDFYEHLNCMLKHTFYYFNQDLLKQALKKGISQDLASRLRKHFLQGENKFYKKLSQKDYCNCLSRKDEYEGVLNQKDYNAFFKKEERGILSEWIKPRRAFRILFSGEKEWIEPSSINILRLYPNSISPAGEFTFKIKVTLSPDKDAVAFYNKEKLKEDVGTTQPLVKVELDDKIKLIDIPLKGKPKQKGEEQGDCCTQTDNCCVLTATDPEDDKHQISLYHFFRNVIIDEILPTDEVINVKVCGLKKIIVQNDESAMDVNGPIMVFGARPKVGSNFYIGSKEIFYKNWQEIWVNVTWKDRPEKFEDHYSHYNFEKYEDKKDKIKNDSFKAKITLLEKGVWQEKEIKDIFINDPALPNNSCSYFPQETNNNTYRIIPVDFNPPYIVPVLEQSSLAPYNVLSQYGFIKFTLSGVSFQHDRFSYAIIRHITALSDLMDPYNISKVQGLIGNTQILVTKILSKIAAIQTKISIIQSLQIGIDADINNSISGLQVLINQLDNYLGNALSISTLTATRMQIIIARNSISSSIIPKIFGIDSKNGSIQTEINIITSLITDDPTPTIALDFDHPNTFVLVGLIRLVKELDTIIKDIADKLKVDEDLKGLPKEPYTPTLSFISLDYTAIATITDIDLIHLYPYPNTYKPEEISLQPPLFPTFCDEGTLFLGLKDLVPGDNLNILFQLAEATSDSESDPEDVWWYYLDSNVWKPLRKGFEVLDDATKNLTTSGIIKLALPANMTKDNTVMPKEYHWIKAAIAKNSKAVGETIAIIPQAMLSVFTNQEANDKLRLANSLKSESISKLSVADASVKSVAQPFDSFGGAVPESESLFYVRVSETLRHKGRAIQAFDYERIVLQAFPELYKAKCINHSFALNAHQYKNDFPYSPGYVMLAVIPDLYKLKAGNSFEPKVPVSIIEDIEKYLQKRTSPFVRFRAMNPRYEKINFCIRVQLVKGKDENYFKEKLKQDIRELLAPWAVGKYDKLTFGQCIYRSDIIRLLETSDYVDFISDFRMGKAKGIDSPDANKTKVCPDTPRSILIAGDIEVCIDKPDCGEKDESIHICLKVNYKENENYSEKSNWSSLVEGIKNDIKDFFSKIKCGQCVESYYITKSLEDKYDIIDSKYFKMARLNSDPQSIICPTSSCSILKLGTTKVCLDNESYKNWNPVKPTILSKAKPKPIIDYCIKDKKETS